MSRLGKFARLAIGLTTSLLAGCAEWSATQTPLPSKAVVELLKPVPVYDKAPCWMQRRWSADNSRKQTAATGKVTVYAPPCVTDKPKEAAKPDEKMS